MIKKTYACLTLSVISLFGFFSAFQPSQAAAAECEGLLQKIVRMLEGGSGYPLISEAHFAKSLKARGIKSNPREMAKAAQTAWRKEYPRVQRLAKGIARTHGLSDDSPAAVLRFLTERGQVGSAAEFKKILEEKAALARSLVSRSGLFEVPQGAEALRIEVKSSVPYPIPLFEGRFERAGNRKEASGVVSVDFKRVPAEFKTEYSQLGLLFHEAYPGHALHFFTLRNEKAWADPSPAAHLVCEGWATYVEYMMRDLAPTVEERFFAHMGFLARLARARNESLLHMRKRNTTQVAKDLVDKLGVSEELAQFEANRPLNFVTDDLPGGGSAYFYGAKLIMELKEEVRSRSKIKEGVAFERCFHSKFLSSPKLDFREIRKNLAKFKC